MAVEGVTGDVKEAGRAGTEGGVVVETVGVPVGTAEEGGDATAAIVPLRSQGFGGEPIGSNDQMEVICEARRGEMGDG